MPRRPRKYWIVKHGLNALQALPHRIWRTGQAHEPAVFRRVRAGDRWVGFAYAESDARQRALSLVTGFSECTEESHYAPIPARVRRKLGGREKKAWFIHGQPTGWQPRWPVGVPAIEDLLGRRHFHQSTLVAISRDEFEHIRAEVRHREFSPSHIPVLGREPRNEQEVLAIVVGAQAALGIERILRVRTAFPDLLVKLKGRREPMHLELELYSKSYLTHGHGTNVTRRDRFLESSPDLPATLPLAILCWIDDASPRRLRNEGKVSRVFELQALLRGENRLAWR